MRIVRDDGGHLGSVNGMPARIRIDPGAVAVPVITSELAKRAKLKAGPLDFEYLIGPRRVTGQSAVAHIDFGSGPIKRRVGWTEAPYRRGADGTIGPGLLPEKIIHFELRPRRPGERMLALPMVGQGGVDSPWGARYGEIQVGGRPMRILFDPGRQRTIATANAASRIAAAYMGRLSGEVQNVEIAFGVERPVRILQLSQPMSMGPLSIRTLGVRTRDFGTLTKLAGAEVGPTDPDEIVVVGKRKKQPKFDYVTLGSDHLERCSSIIFDKAAKQVRLSCV
jgi:hypothetical protein